MKSSFSFRRVLTLVAVLPAMTLVVSGAAPVKKKAAASHKHSHAAHHKSSHEAKRHGAHESARSAKHASARHVAAAAAVGAGAAAVGQAALPAASAPQLPTPDKGTETGLPLPRFASLRADRVYMRRGPGDRYPIDWVYHRRGLPVKIEREFGVWRLVEDPDGQKGWVHQVTLRGTRTFVIPGAPSESGEEKGEASTLPAAQHADAQVVAYVPPQALGRMQDQHDVLLMNSPGPDRKVVAVLQPGAVGRLRACPADSAWCHVTIRSYDGWLERHLLWGVQPGEIIQPD